jgi:ATP-dependent Lhr-like helicase
MAERIAAQLTKILGEEAVTSHHGSLSKERRLDAEQRLKAGTLRALVATASLELGIDIGEIDLVIQVGATRSIATLLQRVGRAGHSLDRVPKGRIFPLTLDELVEAAALLHCVRTSLLDRTAQPPRPLDILAQQVVAECAAREWEEDALFEALKRAWPYRALAREEFDEVVWLHADGRRALLHRDGVGKRLLATRRARLTALQSGGAIPNGRLRVRVEPEGAVVGTVSEDWASRATAATSSSSATPLAHPAGRARHRARADARPAREHPFWLGGGPGRTRELSAALADCAGVRRRAPRARGDAAAERSRGGGRATQACGEALPEAAALRSPSSCWRRAALGCVPTQRACSALLRRGRRHAARGARAVRLAHPALVTRSARRFCVGFGFELQAAANGGVVPARAGTASRSKGPTCIPDGTRCWSGAPGRADVLTRWRWDAHLRCYRACPQRQAGAGGDPAHAPGPAGAAFPQVLACPETLPGGRAVPDDPDRAADRRTA